MSGSMSGSFYYFLGCTVTSLLYPKVPASLGILQLGLTDPAASLFGTATRHLPYFRIKDELGGMGRNKGLLGLILSSFVTWPVNAYLLRPLVDSPGFYGFLLAFSGALSDFLIPSPPPRIQTPFRVRVHLDDNLAVPVVAGGVAALLLK